MCITGNDSTVSAQAVSSHGNDSETKFCISELTQFLFISWIWPQSTGSWTGISTEMKERWICWIAVIIRRQEEEKEEETNNNICFDMKHLVKKIK